MQSQSGIWASPIEYLTHTNPDHPVMFLCPGVLHATARRFQDCFDGLVTYAVKANSHPTVLDNLSAAGLTAFDVASPEEIRLVRRADPHAVLHYNNPVRSDREIAIGIEAGVASWSVDHPEELRRLAPVPRHSEVSVRFKLPVPGASYDFGSKFGATPAEAVDLLVQTAELGFVPALTFHPGTQCPRAEAWVSYIHEAARISRLTGVRLRRLNVGGGFPVSRDAAPARLDDILQTISTAVRSAFGRDLPELVCEPGRAMVGDAACLALRIKSLRRDGTVFLNDGIYGGLADLPEAGPTTRIAVHAPDGALRTGAPRSVNLFGPTCDSLDRLPDGMCLPEDAQTGDHVLIFGAGAYSHSLATQFNGYGVKDVITVLSLSGH